MKNILALFVVAVIILTQANIGHAQQMSTGQGLFDQLLLDKPMVYFVEADPHAIRVEILVKGPLLAELLNYPLNESAIFAAADRNALVKRSLEYFAEHFTLSLNGIPVTPASSRANFLSIGDENSVIKEKPEDEAIADATLGLSFDFPLTEIPKFAQLSLSELPSGTDSVPLRVHIMDQLQMMEFMPYSMMLDWSLAGLQVQRPVLKPVKVSRSSWFGKAKLNKTEALAVMDRLISNIYRAFEYRQESAIYDNLAISVAGKQLATLYLEQKQRMESVNRGGPSVKILNTFVDEIAQIRSSGEDFLVNTEWQVSGEVTHFGHTHERSNRYKAEITLSAVDDQWKISRINVLDESRIK